jgi:ribosomal protein S18 acetylase RimI-like enzyme
VVIEVLNPTKQQVREATASDVPEIVSLINRAFQVERFFKNADRTDAESVQRNMKEGTFLLLYEGGAMVACVYVQVEGDRGYLGTLSVDPSRQRSGLGRRMMNIAEDYCCNAGCKVLDIRVVNLRTELPAIYRKFGFVETGVELPERTRSFTQPVHFIIMTKDLGPA